MSRPTKALFVMFILGSLWIQDVNGLSKPSQATFDNSDHTVAAGLNEFYMGHIVRPEYLTDLCHASTVETSIFAKFLFTALRYKVRY